MPNFTDLTGLAGVAGATAAALLLLPGIARITQPRLAVMLGAIFVLMLIPFSELSIAAYLRGVAGDLSITTLVLSVMWSISCLAKKPLDPACQGETVSSSPEVGQAGNPRSGCSHKGRLGGVSFRRCITLNHTLFSKAEGNSRFVLLMLIALVALSLYPLALGLTVYDPYRLGYGDPQFVAALLLVALAAWIWKYHSIALCIAFATLAWATGWYESDNLWDYLLDPWIAIYALFVITLHGVKMFLRRGKTHET